jgi:23S rRNA pseudouridine2605 synthase
MNSEGVLLLTNDGLLAPLTPPRYGIPRTYLVRVDGIVSEDDLERLRSGVVLDDGKTLPAQDAGGTACGQELLLRMTLHEGRLRQIHRMLQRWGIVSNGCAGGHGTIDPDWFTSRGCTPVGSV